MSRRIDDIILDVVVTLIMFFAAFEFGYLIVNICVRMAL